MRKLPVILACTAAGLLLLGAGWWLGQRDAAYPLAATAAGGGATAQTGRTQVEAGTEPDAAGSSTRTAAPVTSSTGATIAALAPEPLPPANTALTDVFDDLLDRARRGDSRAACRLAADLQRCSRAASRPRDPRFMEDRVANEADNQRRDTMIDFMARMEVEREQTDAMCDGIVDAQLDLAFPLQMQAAQATPELRVWAALSPALDTRFFVNDLDRWQQYRQVAIPWLESAAAAGDLAAVVAMARIHGDDRRFGPPTPPLRELDDARFATYATLMQRYGMEVPPVQRALEQARSRLDAGAAADAERRAAELFRPEALPASPRDAFRDAMQRSFDPARSAPDCD